MNISEVGMMGIANVIMDKAITSDNTFKTSFSVDANMATTTVVFIAFIDI